MKKTAKEWLEELPEPYRSQALENVEKYPYQPNTIVDSLTNAMVCAFEWGDSEQGIIYWSDVYGAADKGEFDGADDGAVVAPTDKQVNGSHYKESDGKLNYELDWYFIEYIARRMQKNKGKYEPYNWQKQTDIEPIKQALIRHCISVFNNDFADGDDELGHIEAIALNAMFIWHQLRNYGK